MSWVWIQPIQKVLDSVGQSEYHSTTQYTSKIEILLFSNKIPLMIPITSETDFRVLECTVLCCDSFWLCT